MSAALRGLPLLTEREGAVLAYIDNPLLPVPPATEAERRKLKSLGLLERIRIEHRGGMWVWRLTRAGISALPVDSDGRSLIAKDPS